MDYEFLIVGAGLAGSACAYLLAQSGKSVLLVEREDAARKDKLCGGMMTPRAVAEFNSIFGASNLGAVRSFEHDSMRILFGAHDRTIPVPNVVGTKRVDLDRFALSSALEAGADLMDKSKVASFDFEQRRAVISGRIPLDIRYRTLVAADGVGSSTRRKLSAFAGAQRLSPSVGSYPSLEAYVPSVSDQLTGQFVPDIKGYCWYAPCGDFANIGICGSGLSSTERARGILDGFAGKLGATLDHHAIRGACIPRGDAPALECLEASAYFLGDAAGLANPVTGEGIYYALKSAHALSECLMGGLPYGRLMARDLMGLKRTSATIPIVYSERNMNRVLSISNRVNFGSGNAARLALRLFADF